MTNQSRFSPVSSVPSSTPRRKYDRESKECWKHFIGSLNGYGDGNNVSRKSGLPPVETVARETILAPPTAASILGCSELGGARAIIREMSPEAGPKNFRLSVRVRLCVAFDGPEVEHRRLSQKHRAQLSSNFRLGFSRDFD